MLGGGGGVYVYVCVWMVFLDGGALAVIVARNVNMLVVINNVNNHH